MGDREKLDAAMAKIHTPEVRAKSVARNREEVKTNTRRGRFETNVNASDWCLRDPNGVVHTFRNLRHFIRTHEWMFTENQLQLTGKRKDYRVLGCLYQLHPNRKKVVTVSQGWTWAFSKTEKDPRMDSR